jgi:MFS family permease
MVVVINTAVAELSNSRRRNLCVSLMVVGYSIGAVVGGAVITLLLKSGEWQSIFRFCGVLTGLFIPLVWIYMPESPAFLARKGGAAALSRVNASLAKMGLPALAALRGVARDISGTPEQVSSGRREIGTRVALLTVCYFGQMFTYYFLLKWAVKLVVDMGYTPAQAGSVLVLANVGGIVAGILFGLASQRYSLKSLTISCMVLNFVFVTWFGFGSDRLGLLLLIAVCAGAFGNACIVGIYAVLARAFPSNVRGTGTGLVVGIGRSGAIFSPILAGALLQAQFEMWQVAITLATGSLLAATMLFFVRLHTSARA